MTIKIITDGIDSDVSVAISWEHEKIHDATTYSFSEAIDYGNGAIRNLLVVTPNTIEEIHFFYIVSSETECDILFYETPVTSNDGTALTAFNRYREYSSLTPVTKIYHTPTIAGGSEGTLLEHKHMGSGKQSGGDNRVIGEIILKKNNKYLLRITNATASNNYISTDLSWYAITED